MTSRAEALTRIRQSLQTGVLPDAVNRLERVTPFPEVDQATLLNSFVREAQAAGSEVFQPTTHEDLLEILTDLVKQAGQPAITWADEDLPIKDIRELLVRVGVTRHVPDIARDPLLRREQWHDLDTVRVGITGALGGLADTGSIIVASGQHRSRAASLLPETHIALLSAARLYATMQAFFAASSAQELTKNSSNLIFITGPSRTADIEMIITRGVHGPKRLCIVLLP
jgi:L-lactate dehydrogenase complex protein LldG